MAMIRQPLTFNERIQLINSLIKQTNLQCDVIKFQQSKKLGNDGFNFGEVGKGWWQGFLKRHGDKIITKKGEKFTIDRLNQITLKNIEQMYDIIYDEMVVANVVKKLPNPIYCHYEGNEVENVEDAFCKTKLIDTVLTYPNCVLFADKTGCTTNQKKDGHIAGTKYITKKGTRVQRMSSTSEGCFTVLPVLSFSNHNYHHLALNGHMGLL